MSDPTWWTPARRKMYGRQTPNGITCQSCGHDVCQCEPRTATIGEHVDAVLAAKDAEIERLRRELEWKAEVVELPDKHPLRLRAEKAERERDEAVAEIGRLRQKVGDLRIISNVNGDWNLRFAAAHALLTDVASCGVCGGADTDQFIWLKMPVTTRDAIETWVAECPYRGYPRRASSMPSGADRAVGQDRGSTHPKGGA